MNKTTITSIIIAVVIILGVIIFSSGKSTVNPSGTVCPINATSTDCAISTSATSTTTVSSSTTLTNNSSSNVTLENGVQIITLQVKGGYSPRQTIAKAGIQTVIRFVTNNTFDCSISIRIPSLNISQYLPQTGSTDVNIGTQSAGTFRGSCGMGMYLFEVDFK